MGPVAGASSFVAGGGVHQGRPSSIKKQNADTSLLSSRSKRVTYKDLEFDPEADVSIGTLRGNKPKQE